MIEISHIGYQVRRQTSMLVVDKIRKPVESQISSAVTLGVEMTVWRHIGHPVSRLIFGQLRQQVWDQVEEAIKR